MVNTPQLSSFHVFVSILQATTCHSNKKWTIPSETAKKTGFGPGTMMNKGFPVIWTEFGRMLLLLHVATCCYMLLPFQPVRPARSTCWRCLCTSTCAWWQHGDFKWSDSNVVVQRWDRTFRHTHKRAHTNCICTHATNRTSTCRKTCRSTYISTQHLKTIHLNLVQTNPSPELSYYHNVYMRVLGATGTWLGCSLPCITT